MSSRFWGLAVLGIFTLALAPSSGQSQTRIYSKEAVQALSKRIDEHLAKVWKKAGVTPAPKAEDHVFFRRLNLDLAGRIPDLLEIDDFVNPTNDSPEKRWDSVDRLLDGYEYPRHFAHVWRSIMLGNVNNQQLQFQMPQFEQWIRERVAKDVTLDKMVQQLLLSQPNNPNMGLPGFGGGGQLPGSPQLFFQVNENKAENIAGASSRVFLGIKIECALNAMRIRSRNGSRINSGNLPRSIPRRRRRFASPRAMCRCRRPPSSPAARSASPARTNS